MFEYIPLAISNIKAAKDILMTIQDLRDFNKISTATREIKERLIESIDSILATKEQFFAFQEKISELEKEKNQLKDWSLEKEKYAPKPIAMGLFAYIDKDFKGLPENEYKLCCNCFEKGIKSPLQISYAGRVKELICSNGCPTILVENFIQIK